MVVEEFEGKTEEEAIEQAIQKLGLRREDIDIEIVESRKPGLFRSGNVRIRVHVGDEGEDPPHPAAADAATINAVTRRVTPLLQTGSDLNERGRGHRLAACARTGRFAPTPWWPACI